MRMMEPGGREVKNVSKGKVGFNNDERVDRYCPNVLEVQMFH